MSESVSPLPVTRLGVDRGSLLSPSRLHLLPPGADTSLLPLLLLRFFRLVSATPRLLSHISDLFPLCFVIETYKGEELNQGEARSLWSLALLDLRRQDAEDSRGAGCAGWAGAELRSHQRYVQVKGGLSLQLSHNQPSLTLKDLSPSCFLTLNRAPKAFQGVPVSSVASAAN